MLEKCMYVYADTHTHIHSNQQMNFRTSTCDQEAVGMLLTGKTMKACQ